jgi:hypothetical protein
LQPGAVYTFSFWARLPPESDVTQVNIATPGCPMIRGRRAHAFKHQIWQRLELTAPAGADGKMFPRMTAQGAPGAVVETANWRLEPGLLVGARENPADDLVPLLEPQTTLAARSMK